MAAKVQRKKQRSPSHAERPAARPSTAGAEQATSRWAWRTFPVFAALAVGALLTFLVDGGSHTPAGFFVQLAALLGVGYSLAHIVVTNIVVAGRVRRRREASERGEAPGEETEEVVVYPEDSATAGRR